MPKTPIKPGLLALLREAHAVEQELVAGLSAEEREQAGTPARWSPKDVVVHISFWRRCNTLRLAALKRGEEPPDFADYQRLNEETFERERLRPWAEVLADADSVFTEQMATAETFMEDELTAAHAALEGRLLWQAILGNGYEHPLLHITQLYIERGDLGRALQLQDQQAAGLLSLDDSPQQHGAVRYNQACILALAGQSERALVLLREALALRPDLVEWSKQDSDLISLRNLPEYHAIYDG